MDFPSTPLVIILVHTNTRFLLQIQLAAILVVIFQSFPRTLLITCTLVTKPTKNNSFRAICECNRTFRTYYFDSKETGNKKPIFMKLFFPSWRSTISCQSFIWTTKLHLISGSVFWVYLPLLKFARKNPIFVLFFIPVCVIM